MNMNYKESPPVFDGNAFESFVCDQDIINDNDSSVTELTNTNNNLAPCNLSQNLSYSYNLTSTLFPSDLYNITDLDYCDVDFSQLIPSKGDDVMSNIAYLDLVSEFCNKKKKLAEDKRRKSSKNNNKNLCKNAKLNKNIKPTKQSNISSNIFYIRKVHKSKCKCQYLKVKRNKIKYLINDDLEMILKTDKRFLRKQKFLLKNKKLENCKKTTNRNFRLFDKDVILKKIANNFLKFIKNIFENLEGTKCVIKKSLKKICNIDNFKDLLDKKLEDIFEHKVGNKTTTAAEEESTHKVLKMNLHLLFSTYFLNSKYFNVYLIPKIQSRYDGDYLSNFLNYIKILL